MLDTRAEQPHGQAKQPHSRPAAAPGSSSPSTPTKTRSAHGPENTHLHHRRGGPYLLGRRGRRIRLSPRLLRSGLSLLLLLLLLWRRGRAAVAAPAAPARRRRGHGRQGLSKAGLIAPGRRPCVWFGSVGAPQRSAGGLASFISWVGGMSSVGARRSFSSGAQQHLHIGGKPAGRLAQTRNGRNAHQRACDPQPLTGESKVPAPAFRPLVRT